MKMSNWFRNTLFLLFVFLSPNIQAITEIVDGIAYELDEATQTAIVADNVAHLSLPVDVIIPNMVEYADLKYAVTAISEAAFKGCNLVSIMLGSGITLLGASAFEDCSLLATITCLSIKPPDCEEDVFVGIAAGCVVYVPVGSATAYEVAAGWDTFVGYIIEDDQVTLNGVTYQLYNDGTAAVTAYTSELPAAVVLPGMVTKNGREFLVVSIGNNAFSGSTQMTSIIIGSDVVTIGDNAFSGCSEMRNITIANPNSPVCGQDAFDGVPSNCRVYVPAGSGEEYRKAAGWEDFNANIVEGEKITVNGVSYLLTANETATVIDYTEELPAIVVLPKAINNNATPYPVISIADKAFFACSDLVAIAIGINITDIGSEVFSGCTQLDSIAITNPAPPDCAADAFASIAAGCKVYVPAGLGADYENATGWEDFGANIIEDDQIILNGVTYQLYNNYTATVTGYTSPPATLTLPETVSGPSGKSYEVTAIGASAFSGCALLTTIYIPAGITSVGASAFVGCTALQSFTVDSENTAYSDNDDVLFNNSKTVLLSYPNAKGAAYSVPDGVSQIGTSAFEGSALTSINAGKDVVMISTDAFKDCTSLEAVVLGDKVVNVGNTTFSGCSALLSIASPSTTPPSCGANVFLGVSSGCKVYVPAGRATAYNNTANEWKNLTVIADNQITKQGVTYQLQQTNSAASVIGYTNEILSQLVIPATITGNSGATYQIVEVAEGAFRDCGAILSATLPPGTVAVRKSAFKNSSTLQTINLSSAAITTIGDSAFSACVKLQTVDFSNTIINTVGVSAFSGCISLKNIDLSASKITEIRSFMFYQCSNLTTVHLPTTLNSIALGAFALCSNLEEINFPTTLTSIEASAFSSCSSLKIADLSNTKLTIIADNTFLSCTQLSKVVLNNEITSLGVRAFSDCIGLKAIVSPRLSPPTCDNNVFDKVPKNECRVYVSSIEAILMHKAALQWKEFYRIIISDDDEITEQGVIYKLDIDDTAMVIGYTENIPSHVTIPATVTDNNRITYQIIGLAKEAFANCDIIEDINLPAELAMVEEGAFYNCSNLQTANLASTAIETIGDSLFSDCGNLTDITLPANIKSFGYRAFASCTRLTKIDFPSKLTFIGEAAFSACSSLTAIDLSKTGVTTISDYAFSSCTKLSKVTLVDKVISIGESAFLNCITLKEIHSPSLIPPACGDNAFGGVSKTGCRVYVSQTSAVAYKLADQWKEFFYIGPVSIDDVPVESMKVYISDGSVVIQGVAEGVQVAVYTILGKTVDVTTATDEQVKIALPTRGIYLVKVGDKTMKVMW